MSSMFVVNLEELNQTTISDVDFEEHMKLQNANGKIIINLVQDQKKRHLNANALKKDAHKLARHVG